MADVPQDLLQQIKELEELFTVDTAKLKQIVDHFVKELEKGASRCKPSTPRCAGCARSIHILTTPVPGLSVEGANIVSFSSG